MVDHVKPDLRHLATEVVQKLQSSGFEAYFAGGSVRDQLMGTTPEDYDIATSARPDQIMGLFPRSVHVGEAFGVVMVRQQGRSLEVATFRSDGIYSDGRRPDSVTYTTAEHDAQRRDFTCNGLFFDPIVNRLIDYVGGQADIHAKILRAIGDPAHRFREDHLRMMRAIRFAARLRFTIEPATWMAICANADKLSEISRERIGQELRKILKDPSRVTAVTLLIESGLFRSFWPACATVAANKSIRFPRLAALPKSSSFSQALAALVLDMAEPQKNTSVPAAALATIEGLQCDIVLSTEEAESIKWILTNLPVLGNWRNMRLAAFKRMLDHAWSDDLLRIYAAEHQHDGQYPPLAAYIAELQKAGPLTPDRFVNGGDLIAMGVLPGPRFKLWLEELYDRQLENDFPDRPSALLAAKQLIQRPS